MALRKEQLNEMIDLIADIQNRDDYVFPKNKKTGEDIVYTVDQIEKILKISFTKFEIVYNCDEWTSFSFEDLLKVFEDKYGHGEFSEYAWAEHQNDTKDFHHYHIGAFAQPMLSTKKQNKRWENGEILYWFKDFKEIIYRWYCVIERISHSPNSYVTYLLHKTVGSKADGKLPPLSYDGTLDFEKCVEEYDKYVALDLDNLLGNIIEGKIREWEFYENRTLELTVLKNGMLRKVKDAFSLFYANYGLGADRDNSIKQFWVSGLAGNGKTALCKYAMYQLGCQHPKDVYVTAPGKNLFDDYRGERFVIIDDIDKCSLSPKAILKLLDLFTKSMVACRYYNKVICADVVCITSSVTPESWWKTVLTDKVDGNVYQLLRRLNYGSWRIDKERNFDVDIKLYNGLGELVDTVFKALPDDVYTLVKNAEKCKDKEKVLADIDNIFTLSPRYFPWDKNELEV